MMDSVDRKRAALREAFPMRALLSAAALTIALLAGGVWVVGRLYSDLIHLVETELRLGQLTGQIMRLDEVLTMSARMAAATSNLKWEARYRTFEPQLDSAIKEAIALAPEAYIGISAKATDTANQALVDMENQAFVFVRAGQGDEAAAILFSKEYEKQKAIYAEGMDVSKRAIESRAKAMISKQHRRIAFVAAISIVALAALVAVWIRIVALIRRFLESAASARMDLAEANRDLERRVKERTAELLAGRDALEEEMRLRARAELGLRQAQKLESVGRLAAGIAHEINTPIQFVSDNVHFVRDAIKDLTDLVERYQIVNQSVLEGSPSLQAVAEAREAEAAVNLPYIIVNIPDALRDSLEGLSRVATLVRSMKEFAYSDQKVKASVDVNEALLNTITIARSEYEHVAEVVTDLGDIPRVTCYSGDLKQSFLDLIVNGAHAIADIVKGTDEKGLITVRTRSVGDSVLISISDTGCGIKPEIRDRIFDPFFTTKEVGKGTDQGLALCRSIVVQKHGGELTFETEVGKGTTFYVRLPVNEENEQVVKQEPATADVNR